MYLEAWAARIYTEKELRLQYALISTDHTHRSLLLVDSVGSPGRSHDRPPFAFCANNSPWPPARRTPTSALAGARDRIAKQPGRRETRLQRDALRPSRHDEESEDGEDACEKGRGAVGGWRRALGLSAVLEEGAGERAREERRVACAAAAVARWLLWRCGYGAAYGAATLCRHGTL